MKNPIIVLAAGSSSRMGTSKQLLLIGQEPLLKRTCHIALQASPAVVVVLGANEAAHRTTIAELPVSIVLNKEWELGMGSSLKAGLQEARRKWPDMQSVLIMVCDQPHLTSQHLTLMLGNSAEVVASTYAGTAGVPVLFRASQFYRLEQLPDHEGAKALLKDPAAPMATVPLPGGEIDLDTPEDYHTFIQ